MRPAPKLAAPIREHEGEPVPGLPERLPPGETILWQGAPCWRTLARRAFHVRGLALYFAALAAWRAGALLADGANAAEAVRGAAWMVLLGAVALALIAGFAWLSARGALYTLTNRRLVFRVGVALPTTVNIPFAAVSDAGFRPAKGGTGDIVLALLPQHRVSWIALWPHARPWRFGRTEPMLRSIPDAERVGGLLARALAAADAAQPVVPTAAASILPQHGGGGGGGAIAATIAPAAIRDTPVAAAATARPPMAAAA